MHCKAADWAGVVGLAEQEIEDSKLAVNYCRVCHGRRNSQSLMRVCWEVGLEQSKRGALLLL